MEPGVPFALLGAVQVLLVVAAGALAAASGLRRTSAGVLVAVGSLVLAAVEVRTALRLGFVASDDLALLRAAATLLIAAGVWSGGLGRRRAPAPALYGVVVPFGAAGGPSAFVATASVLAGLALLANRRDALGLWVASGFASWAMAAGLAPRAADSAWAAQTVAGLRGAGALAIIVGLTLLAAYSLLSKVVSAILAGVVTMAVAAVGVVGNVVVDSYDRQTRETVAQAAAARGDGLEQLTQQVQRQAKAAATFCSPGSGACGGFLKFFGSSASDFLLRVRANGTTEVGETDPGQPLPASSRLGLSRAAAVQQVLQGADDTFADYVRLGGTADGFAVIGVAAGPESQTASPSRPAEVWVYGVRIDSRYAALDLDRRVGGLRFSILSGDPLRVSGSNLSANDQRRLLAQVLASGALDRPVPDDGVTLGSQGTTPTVALLPVRSGDETTVGFLAVTRDPGQALRTQRDALRLLLITALLALSGVAAAAVLLGRRTIEPVRRLTAAAERVAAGDLATRVGVADRDEVGTLSRTFDVMTGSLDRLTGDLRASAARLETVLSSMTDGLLATDGDGVVTSVNRAALLMLGLEELDVVGEELVLVADVRSVAGEPLLPRDGVLLEEPGLVRRPDGSELPVRVALLPLEGADGVVLVLRDTTREREVERMKTEFLSNVSHELRTPLTPIRGYAELLVTKPDLPAERVVAFATTIRDESLKMNRVVDLLVDVAAIEAGRVHVTPKDVAVKDLLDAHLTAWQRRAPERARDLRRRVAARLPLVHVDPVWLGKALDELVDNALKYTPVGTPITLVAGPSPDGMRVRVAVRDAGPGFSAEHRERMFASFEQVDGSATRKVGGLGLGLSFVRRLSEDAGFPLSVASTPGKGSEFALDLPVA